MRRTVVLPVVAVVSATALLAGCTEGAPTTIGPPIGPATTEPATRSTAQPTTRPTTQPTTQPATGPTPERPPASAPATARSPGAAPSLSGSGGAAAAAVAVPSTVMLRPTDWAGGRLRVSTTGVTTLKQTEPSACQPRTAYPSDRYRVGARTVGIASDQPESGGVEEVIVRYAPGRPEQALAEMRRVLSACHSYRPAPGVVPTATRSYRLEAERFAGDDALLVRRTDRADTGREYGAYITVVRIGDALITTTGELGEGTVDRGLALRLADVGARRGACLRSTC